MLILLVWRPHVANCWYRTPFVKANELLNRVPLCGLYHSDAREMRVILGQFLPYKEHKAHRKQPEWDGGQGRLCVQRKWVLGMSIFRLVTLWQLASYWGPLCLSLLICQKQMSVVYTTELSGAFQGRVHEVFEHKSWHVGRAVSLHDSVSNMPKGSHCVWVHISLRLFGLL